MMVHSEKGHVMSGPVFYCHSQHRRLIHSVEPTAKAREMQDILFNLRDAWIGLLFALFGTFGES